MFFNHLIDAAKQKAASIKWENARTRFDVRIRIRVYRPNGTDGRTRYGLKFPEQHPIKYVEQHPIKYVAPLILVEVR